MASSLCSFPAPALSHRFCDNMGRPLNPYGTNLSSSFQGILKITATLRTAKRRLAGLGDPFMQ
jgi:hypothetical protein